VNALDCLLSNLFDYAGLFPPANLSLSVAVENYRHYSTGPQKRYLGCFVVPVFQLSALHQMLIDSDCSLPLSVTGSDTNPWLDAGSGRLPALKIEAVEVKAESSAHISSLSRRLPAGIIPYFEIPVANVTRDILSVVSSCGGRAKLRLGGVNSAAIPDPDTVAVALQQVAISRLPFKATAGLHHPIRSFHALSSEPTAPRAMMHGFLNFCCASALLHFGGSLQDAAKLLAEEDPSAWRVANNCIQWRDAIWTTPQIAEWRRNALMSIGSCSFTEPFEDLEALGWLQAG
jgi:hypothetical protein